MTGWNRQPARGALALAALALGALALAPAGEAARNDARTATAATTAAARSIARPAAVQAAAACWSARVARTAPNSWTYWQRVDWCGNGAAVVWRQVQRGGQVAAGWSFTPLGLAIADGAGWSRAWSQGRFCFLVVFCSSPWIEMTVRANGAWAWRAG